MSNDIKPRIRVQSQAKKGELVEVKTLITHPMESGQRKDAEGKLIARLIVSSFEAKYNDKPVLSGKFEPAISANPYMSFYVRVEESGTLKLTWTDDEKQNWSSETKIEVA